MFSKRYREEIRQIKQLLSKSVTKVSVYVMNDVLQFLVVYVGVVLAYGGDLLQNKQ